MALTPLEVLMNELPAISSDEQYVLPESRDGYAFFAGNRSMVIERFEGSALSRGESVDGRLAFYSKNERASVRILLRREELLALAAYIFQIVQEIDVREERRHGLRY